MTQISSLNPATGKKIKTYTLAQKKQLHHALDAGTRAFPSWSSLSAKERSAFFLRLSQTLRKNVAIYATMISTEMGKPITEARAEIEKCAWTCDYFAEHSSSFLADELLATEHKKSFVHYEPLGTVLGIMPWNFPFWQVFRCCVPALILGNTFLLKHSNVVPGCSLLLQELFTDAGFPDSVFQSLLTDARGVASLIPSIDAVSLTGSVAAGKTIASLAGSHLKKIVLELGGSDPFMVLSDADIEKASSTAVQSRYQNTGQSCIAAKRFFVVASVYDAFLQAVTSRVEALRVGDPLDATTQIGPLVREEQRKFLEQQVARSVQNGAHLHLGGKRIPGKGFFYQPTILTRVRSHHPVLCEETFGPVLPLVSVKNAEEALHAANTTSFGLGASIWSANLLQAEHYAHQVQSGFVSINSLVKSDPRLPFGGIKQSGIGRELGKQGFLEFANVKTLVID